YQPAAGSFSLRYRFIAPTVEWAALSWPVSVWTGLATISAERELRPEPHSALQTVMASILPATPITIRSLAPKCWATDTRKWTTAGRSTSLMSTESNELKATRHSTMTRGDLSSALVLTGPRRLVRSDIARGKRSY